MRRTLCFVVTMALAIEAFAVTTVGVTPKNPPHFDRESACKAAKDEAMNWAKLKAKLDLIKNYQAWVCHVDRCSEVDPPKNSSENGRKAWVCVASIVWSPADNR